MTQIWPVSHVNICHCCTLTSDTTSASTTILPPLKQYAPSDRKKKQVDLYRREWGINQQYLLNSLPVTSGGNELTTFKSSTIPKNKMKGSFTSLEYIYFIQIYTSTPLRPRGKFCTVYYTTLVWQLKSSVTFHITDFHA